MKFTKSEKKVITKIRKTMSLADDTKYMFWLIYDDENNAIDWDGGYDLPVSLKFRNKYTLEHGKCITKNW